MARIGKSSWRRNESKEKVAKWVANAKKLNGSGEDHQNGDIIGG